MATVAPEYARRRAAITERLNAHDLLGVMDMGTSDGHRLPSSTVRY